MKGSSRHRSLFRFLSLTAVILSSLVTEYHAVAVSETAASNPPEADSVQVGTFKLKESTIYFIAFRNRRIDSG